MRYTQGPYKTREGAARQASRWLTKHDPSRLKRKAYRIIEVDDDCFIWISTP